MSKRFQRRQEDFTCENCGVEVAGNGYTNHCPMCLWSKHVDVMPGDRAAQCHGLMKPTNVELSGGRTFIVQTCLACGHTRRNTVSAEDNWEAVTHISRSYARQKMG